MMCRFQLVLFLLLLLVLPLGCSVTKKTQPTTPNKTIMNYSTVTVPHEDSPLKGTSWRLISIYYSGDNRTHVQNILSINLRFTEHGYEVEDPKCGGFGGTYYTNNGKIILGPATYAWEIPEDDQTIHELYLALLSVLHKAKTYRLTNNRLFIWGSDNNTCLVFD
jgi:hypothetical protein